LVEPKLRGDLLSVSLIIEHFVCDDFLKQDFFWDLVKKMADFICDIRIRAM
jgi:hypothetical protein